MRARNPFALSLSKGSREGFDKLSPNGGLPFALSLSKCSSRGQGPIVLSLSKGKLSPNGWRGLQC